MPSSQWEGETMRMYLNITILHQLPWISLNQAKWAERRYGTTPNPLIPFCPLPPKFSQNLLVCWFRFGRPPLRGTDWPWLSPRFIVSNKPWLSLYLSSLLFLLISSLPSSIVVIFESCRGILTLSTTTNHRRIKYIDCARGETPPLLGWQQTEFSVRCQLKALGKNLSASVRYVAIR